MAALGLLLIQLLSIFSWIIIIWVIVSWLVAFNVINLSNPYARKAVELMERLIAPVMKPLRNIIPTIGGIDITPLIVIIGIQILQQAIFQMMVV